MAIWLIVAIVGGELFARALLSSPSTQIFDPALGYVNSPGDYFQAREGFQRLRLNSLGLNAPEPGPKVPGRMRALFIGDSMTFAAQVPSDANFVSQVGRRLPRLETVNAGRDALGPQDWPAMIDRLEPAVKPDLIVLMVSRGDAFDLRDAGVTIEHDAAGRPTGLSRPPSGRDAMQERLEPIMRHSALATFLVRRANSELTALRTGDSWTGWMIRGGKATIAGRNSGEEALDRAAIEAQLDDILELVNRGRRIAIVALPAYRYEAHGKVELEPRSQAEAGLFEAAARRAGLPFVDAGPAMAAAYARTGRPLTGFRNSRLGEGHLNAWGHEVVAAAITRGLAAQGLEGPR
ncbi:GDSL-type esterase/lipase family protein [Rhizorhabdus dicambivorans]|uniref:SGNH/GDSL hydrolase family protein n=1 Tax=Rhizorhabdus dicambivorans TaxID=1850238 RepID=A0A2A4FSN4_9SPHN|nr:GDSL-type esterase/lipase family protein [Rhizorhabdus dicambivorans]ATE64610.1 SGNH/GDSL hydrolase family protein [Rhizorhabdus dicambivorans]PCE40730.1 SGNH/GDSL hydrolase family protein [Rhizorhabdus dicambivorans]